MISFDKPAKLNGNQLNEELLAAGVKLVKSDSGLPNQEYEAPSLDGNNVLWLNISKADATIAAQVVSTHVGKDPAPKTIEQKLAMVGLNLDDLKTALGL